MKRTHSLILIVAFLLLSNGSFCQQYVECDTIYTFIDTMPEYENGSKGLMDYFSNEIIPVLYDCIERDSTLITSMYLSLIIDRTGKVIDVDFIRIDATDQCKNDLKEKMLTMPSWSPGIFRGEAVCCSFLWPVSCILWQ